MARVPYTIFGIVKDTDGTTNVSGATVRVINTAKKEYVEWTSAGDGSFSTDLADSGFATDYSNGDAVQVCIYKDKKSTWFRHTVDTGTPANNVGNKILHNTQAVLGPSKLFAGLLSNQDDSAEYYIELYDGYDDSVIVPRIDISPNSSVPFNFGYIGKIFINGICVIRETDTANKVEVCMVVK